MRVRNDVRIISAQGIIFSPVSFHFIEDVISLLIRHTWGADEKSQYCKKCMNIPKSHCIAIYSFYTWNTRTLTCFDPFCGSSSGSVHQYLYKGECKLKFTLVQALRLCIGRTAHRRSRGIALLFHDHGTRRGWGVRVMHWPLFAPGKDPVPIVQEAGWAPGPVWTGAENLATTGIRSPDIPAPSQLLYRLSYPAHKY